MSNRGSSSGRSEKLFVIAEGFPPLGGSGVQRTTKFVKYLLDFGWQSAVLTGDSERYRSMELDRSLLSEIPDSTEILRLPEWNPAAKFFRMISPRRNTGAPTFNSLATPTETPAPDAPGALRRAFRAMRFFLVAPVGDGFWYWNLRWRGAALNYCREVGARAIYVSGSPFSSMLLGLWLKRRTGLPFVADFRDAWTCFSPSAQKGLRFRFNRRAERRVLRGADAIICVNSRIKEEFEQIEPACCGKCTVITNGFDPADFSDLPPVRRTATLTHVGIAWEDSPKPVLFALARLEDRRALPDAFRVRFLGGLPPSSLALVAELGLSDRVIVESRVRHSEAITAMREATALLLLPGAKNIAPAVPGKFYEYMAARRPVLCVSPTELAPELVRESGCGLAVGPDDSAGLEREIEMIACDPDGWEAMKFCPRPEVIDRFSRRSLSGRLAEVLDRLAGGEPSE
jgi:glycosyltransferase involved in cell wall biosynthesis